ncbi:MAG: DUF4974 domain-containing protein [Cyclobacteriaceae bacterium]|nr:DUF4974 domain-containing protein [Cyclobacteriaceae bacterium SS2]
MNGSWLEKYDQPQTHGSSPKSEFDAFMELSKDPSIVFDENKAWDRVSSRLSITPAKKRFNFTVIAKVAAAFVLVALSFVVYQVSLTDKPHLVEISVTETPMNYTLPDGSVVYLDINSSISFQEDFTERIVNFEGRGFYDVVKGGSAFTVRSNDLSVTVLGTAFSVETYKDHFSSFVSEGLVQVSDQHTNQMVNPGELLTYQKSTRKFAVNKNDNPNILAWKTGKFIFKNTPFDEVTKNLENYYKVDFSNVSQFKNCKVTAEFDQQELSEVLAVLGEILNIEFKISKSEVKTLGKGCR